MTDTELLNNSEPTVDKQKASNGDFPSIGIDLLKRVNFKVAFFIFIMGLYLFSDIFVEHVLPANYREGDTANTNGTMVQLILLVFAYMTIDLLVQSGMI
jgi:hypothetical protein